MAYEIGSLIKDSGDDCHVQFIGVLSALAVSAGWAVERDRTISDQRELILSSTGLSGIELIYVGFRTYQSASSDYYNIQVMNCIGFNDSANFENQAGSFIRSMPAHNLAIDYFLSINAQRIAFCLKVGTPTFEHAYVGKFLPYARPGEYPAPLIIGAMFNEDAATKRFSETSRNFPYSGLLAGTSTASGASLRIRDQAGSWNDQYIYPFSQGSSSAYTLNGTGITTSRALVPVSDEFSIEPLILYDVTVSFVTGNVYGEIDGIFAIGGFNNGSENIMQIGGSSIIDQSALTLNEAVTAIHNVSGRAFVILQNAAKTNFNDFVAMEMIA